MKTVVAFFALLGIIGLGALYYVFHSGEPASHFRTAPVVRGDLVWTIGATGSVEPEEVVDVGAQVTGRIKALGPDLRGKTDPRYKDKSVDYGSPVEQGALLAQIDEALYKAQYDQAAATLEHAKADLGELTAKRDQACRSSSGRRSFFPRRRSRRRITTSTRRTTRPPNRSSTWARRRSSRPRPRRKWRKQTSTTARFARRSRA